MSLLHGVPSKNNNGLVRGAGKRRDRWPLSLSLCSLRCADLWHFLSWNPDKTRQHNRTSCLIANDKFLFERVFTLISCHATPLPCLFSPLTSSILHSHSALSVTDLFSHCPLLLRTLSMYHFCSGPLFWSELLEFCYNWYWDQCAQRDLQWIVVLIMSLLFYFDTDSYHKSTQYLLVLKSIISSLLHHWFLYFVNFN